MSTRRYVPKPSYEVPTTPFSTSEEAWFWFVRCQRIRRDGARLGESSHGIRRPCEPDDLYRAVMTLVRRNVIDSRHLVVLGSFGLEERPPDARCPAEIRAHRLWDEALDRLTTVLRGKGIVA